MFSISLFLFWQTNSIRFTVRFLLMISIYYVSTSLINKKRRIYKFFYSIKKLSDVDFLLVFCFWHYNKVLLFISFYNFRGKELKLKNARNSSRILKSHLISLWNLSVPSLCLIGLYVKHWYTIQFEYRRRGDWGSITPVSHAILSDIKPFMFVYIQGYLGIWCQIISFYDCISCPQEIFSYKFDS